MVAVSTWHFRPALCIVILPAFCNMSRDGGTLLKCVGRESEREKKSEIANPEELVRIGVVLQSQHAIPNEDFVEECWLTVGRLCK